MTNYWPCQEKINWGLANLGCHSLAIARNCFFPVLLPEKDPVLEQTPHAGVIEILSVAPEVNVELEAESPIRKRDRLGVLPANRSLLGMRVLGLVDYHFCITALPPRIPDSARVSGCDPSRTQLRIPVDRGDLSIAGYRPGLERLVPGQRWLVGLRGQERWTRTFTWRNDREHEPRPVSPAKVKRRRHRIGRGPDH